MQQPTAKPQIGHPFFSRKDAMTPRNCHWSAQLRRQQSQPFCASRTKPPRLPPSEEPPRWQIARREQLPGRQVPNHRGDTVLATSNTGTVLGQYDYTPFGETLTTSGSYAPRFSFSSKERDASGLVYYGFRHYAPTLCRWITPDPIKEDGGLNLYQFCGNGPVDFLDPFGLDALDWAANFSAGAADVLSFGVTEGIRDAFPEFYGETYSRRI